MIDEVRKSGVPLKTRQSTDWGVKIWKDWAINRRSMPFVEEMEKNCPLCDNFNEMVLDSLVFWLPKFVVEVRKANGEYYCPDSLYNICCALQRSFKSNERADVNIFNLEMLPSQSSGKCLIHI